MNRFKFITHKWSANYDGTQTIWFGSFSIINCLMTFDFFDRQLNWIHLHRMKMHFLFIHTFRSSSILILNHFRTAIQPKRRFTQNTEWNEMQIWFANLNLLLMRRMLPKSIGLWHEKRISEILKRIYETKTEHWRLLTTNRFLLQSRVIYDDKNKTNWNEQTKQFKMLKEKRQINWITSYELELRQKNNWSGCRAKQSKAREIAFEFLSIRVTFAS